MIGPKIQHVGPPSGLLAYFIGRFILSLFGWNVVGHLPAGKKFMMIGAPHTSNWDFPFGLSALYVYRIKVSWIGKDSLFNKPFGGFMRWLGGIPVHRDSSHGVVDQIAKQYKNSPKMAIAMAPEGTRKKSDLWKSGFYWIAHTAQVPIVCGYLDYAHKEIGLGLSFVPTGNVKQDMDQIRGFYEGIQGKFPDKTTPVRLIDEDN